MVCTLNGFGAIDEVVRLNFSRWWQWHCRRPLPAGGGKFELWSFKLIHPGLLLVLVHCAASFEAAAAAPPYWPNQICSVRTKWTAIHHASLFCTCYYLIRAYTKIYIHAAKNSRTDDSVTNDLPDPSSCHLCDNNQLKNDARPEKRSIVLHWLK